MSPKGKKLRTVNPDETTRMIGKRLFAFRKVLQIESGRLAEILDISPDCLLEIEQGKRALPSDRLTRLYHHFGLNILWLLTGIGSMFDEKSEMKNKLPLLIELFILLQVPEVGTDMLNTLERAKVQFKDKIQEAIDQGKIII